jgi:catechol 2,3-dioxygenase-like lactoylglutathione lyase family enzyme
MDVVDAPLADMQFDDRGQSMFQEAQNDRPLGSEGHGYHGATAPIAQDIGGHRIGADGHLGPWNVRRPGHGGGEHSQETIQIAVGSTSTTSRFPPSGWVFPRPLLRFTGCHGDPCLRQGEIVLDFSVSDVDRELARLGRLGVDWVRPPTDQPWGARAMILRDPEGHAVSVFS